MYSIHNKSTSSPRLVGSYSTCYLYEMLPIQSVLYEMLPRQNVTIRKCTIQNVTDPGLICSNCNCESGRPTGMFLAWFWDSKLSGPTLIAKI